MSLPPESSSQSFETAELPVALHSEETAQVVASSEQVGAAASEQIEAVTSEEVEATASETAIEETASLPVPVGPLRSQLTMPREEEKPSLWKRLRMRRRNGDPSSPAASGDVAARLGAIEQQIDAVDATLRDQLEAINTRLEEVWESEEQLSHLADIQDKLDRLAQSHIELSIGIASLRRTILGLSVLVILAAVASGLIYGSLFQ